MEYKFENSLHYSSPGHGDWGVVRIGMLLPESCQLFVCPFACGRHGAIGALKQGFKDRLFYLFLEQSDIIDGYDSLILSTVDEVLEVLENRPKAFYIFVSCLDDLIGTDHESLLESLHEKYPEIHFLTGHMNPISLDSKTPPPVSIRMNLYSLLEKKNDGKESYESRNQGSLNFIGSCVKVSKSSEIYDFVRTMGVNAIHHISDYNTFSDYQEMAESRGNLVLGAAGMEAARQMERRLGIPWIFLPVTYQMDEIEQQYRKIGQMIGFEDPVNYDFSAAREKAKTAVWKALAAVKDMPVIIDGTAVSQPFGLAEAMLVWGFRVVRIESQSCPEFDRKHMEWVCEHHPEVEVFQTEHHRSVLFDRRMEESLALGVEGAYLSGSKYVADLFNDEGMFGYDGIVRLMNLLIEAVKNPVNLEELINRYGLVV